MPLTRIDRHAVFVLQIPVSDTRSLRLVSKLPSSLRSFEPDHWEEVAEACRRHRRVVSEETHQ